MFGLKAAAKRYLREQGVTCVVDPATRRKVKLGNAKTIDVVKLAIDKGF